VCVFYAVQSTAHNTHAILGHAATPPHNKIMKQSYWML